MTLLLTTLQNTRPWRSKSVGIFIAKNRTPNQPPGGGGRGPVLYALASPLLIGYCPLSGCCMWALAVYCTIPVRLVPSLMKKERIEAAGLSLWV
jgi:hypothetical protein